MNIESKTLRIFEKVTHLIAFLVCLTLILSSLFLLWEALAALLHQNIDLALQDGLFILILLEMFYVIKSFIKYGSINVSIVINIGAIAVVKELIFNIKDINWAIASSFSILFVSMGILYFAEIFSFEKKKDKQKEVKDS